jgi:hypothetical protein
MMAGHRNKLRRIRLASMQLAGWSIYPDTYGWAVRDPAGLRYGPMRTKERAVAFAENQMVHAGLLKGRYFNGYR